MHYPSVNFYCLRGSMWEERSGLLSYKEIGTVQKPSTTGGHALHAPEPSSDRPDPIGLKPINSSARLWTR
jgi:hypothetical protein